MPEEMSKERRAEYLKLLELHNVNRIDLNTRKWETLKYFQSVVLALLGGAAVALSTGIDRGLFCKPLILSIVFASVVGILLVVAAGAAWLGIKNLKRESELLFYEEASAFKIAKLLGLDVTVPRGERWLPDDEHLLMAKWRNHGAKGATLDLETWAKQSTEEHILRRKIDWLFRLELALAAFALFLVILVLVTSQACPTFCPPPTKP